MLSVFDIPGLFILLSILSPTISIDRGTVLVISFTLENWSLVGENGGGGVGVHNKKGGGLGIAKRITKWGGVLIKWNWW